MYSLSLAQLRCTSMLLQLLPSTLRLPSPPPPSAPSSPSSSTRACSPPIATGVVRCAHSSSAHNRPAFMPRSLPRVASRKAERKSARPGRGSCSPRLATRTRLSGCVCTGTVYTGPTCGADSEDTSARTGEWNASAHMQICMAGKMSLHGFPQARAREHSLVCACARHTGPVPVQMGGGQRATPSMAPVALGVDARVSPGH